MTMGKEHSNKYDLHCYILRKLKKLFPVKNFQNEFIFSHQ